MAWDEEVQKTQSILGDIGSVVEQGLSIFSQVKNTVFPAAPVSEPVAQQQPPTAKPQTQPAQTVTTSQPAWPAGLDSKTLIFAAAIIGLLLMSRK